MFAVCSISSLFNFCVAVYHICIELFKNLIIMWEKTVCLVTGVGHGVGLGLATTLGSLLKNNSLLIITSRSKKNLAELTATIKAKNPNVTVCGVDWWDLTNPDAEQYRKDLKVYCTQCFLC